LIDCHTSRCPLPAHSRREGAFLRLCGWLGRTLFDVATHSTAALIDIYQAIEASGQYPTMRRGGIVGDAAHARRATYHISVQDQPYRAGNYTLHAPADRRGRTDIARAIDLTMGPADMNRMGDRLWAACVKNHRDPGSEPRIEIVRDWYGRRSGVGSVTGWNRYDSGGKNVGPASSDSSHDWHTHISIFTDYADDPVAMRGLIDIILGRPLQEEDMPFTDADKQFIRDVVDNRIDRIAAAASAKTLDDLMRKDGIWPAPSLAPTAESNPHWAGLSLLTNPSQLLYSVHKKIDALAEVITGEDVDTDAIRAELATLRGEVAELAANTPEPLPAAARSEYDETDDIT
jgi:hypothetical protein